MTTKTRETYVDLRLTGWETDFAEADGSPNLEAAHLTRWEIQRIDAATHQPISSVGAFVLTVGADEEWTVAYDDGVTHRILARNCDELSANELVRMHYSQFVRTGRVAS